MLSKKFYNISTFIYILVLVIYFIAQWWLMSGFVSSFQTSSGGISGNFSEFAAKQVSAASSVQLKSFIVGLLFWPIGLAYYILILILSVQLYSAGKRISMGDLICIIIFAPFDWIFYLVLLRKKLKIMESEKAGVAPVSVS